MKTDRLAKDFNYEEDKVLRARSPTQKKV